MKTLFHIGLHPSYYTDTFSQAELDYAGQALRDLWSPAFPMNPYEIVFILEPGKDEGPEIKDAHLHPRHNQLTEQQRFEALSGAQVFAQTDFQCAKEAITGFIMNKREQMQRYRDMKKK